MAYISSSDAFRSSGSLAQASLGCCADCPCARRRLGYAPLAEWYERDDEPEPPPRATPATAANAAVGEYTPERVLRPANTTPYYLQKRMEKLFWKPGPGAFDPQRINLRLPLVKDPNIVWQKGPIIIKKPDPGQFIKIALPLR